MIGSCVYLTCESKIGSTFRSAFCAQPGGYDWVVGGQKLSWVPGTNDWRIEDILLCPTHTRLFEEVRRTHGYRHFMLTSEGWAYLRPWLDAMGFAG